MARSGGKIALSLHRAAHRAQLQKLSRPAPPTRGLKCSLVSLDWTTNIPQGVMQVFGAGGSYTELPVPGFEHPLKCSSSRAAVLSRDAHAAQPEEAPAVACTFTRES